MTVSGEQSLLLSLEAECPGPGFYPAPCSHGPYLGCFQSALGLDAGAAVKLSGDIGPLQMGRANSHQVMPELAIVTSKKKNLSNLIKRFRVALPRVTLLPIIPLAFSLGVFLPFVALSFRGGSFACHIGVLACSA